MAIPISTSTTANNNWPGSKNGSTLDNYVLDANGNRTQVSQVNGNITYDDSNRITQYGDVSFSYDTNGNLVTRTENGKVTHYAYDLLNRISQLKIPIISWLPAMIMIFGITVSLRPRIRTVKQVQRIIFIIKMAC